MTLLQVEEVLTALMLDAAMDTSRTLASGQILLLIAKAHHWLYKTLGLTWTIEATRAGLYLVTNAGVRNVDASSSTASIALDGSSAGENKVTYTGGAAADTIKGSLNGDLLTGNGGNDTITGGLAADTINVGGGSNSVVFTSGLSIDKITSYTANDVGAFDLSELETDGAVEANETLNFVTASGTSVLAGDSIGMQTISGPTTLATTTNVLKYTHFSVTNASALETRLETQSIITSNAALNENDAFLIQYMNYDSNTYSYAIAHIEDAGVGQAQTSQAGKLQI